MAWQGKYIFLVVWNKYGHSWNSEPYARKRKKDKIIAAAVWKYVWNCLNILHVYILIWRWSLSQNLSYIDYAMPALKLISHGIPNYNNVWFFIMNRISHKLSTHYAIFYGELKYYFTRFACLLTLWRRKVSVFYQVSVPTAQYAVSTSCIKNQSVEVASRQKVAVCSEIVQNT